MKSFNTAVLPCNCRRLCPIDGFGGIRFPVVARLSGTGRTRTAIRPRGRQDCRRRNGGNFHAICNNSRFGHQHQRNDSGPLRNVDGATMTATRARAEIKRRLFLCRAFRKLLKFSEPWPRPAHCLICGDWTWCTDEPAPYSTAHGFLCTPCAEENEIEVDRAWGEYYSGRL